MEQITLPAPPFIKKATGLIKNPLISNYKIFIG